MPKFCPKKDCPCFQLNNKKITRDGTYPIDLSDERRQMFYCHGGKHRFSEMKYSELVNKKGSEKEYIQTAKLIKYGLSCEQIADVLGRDIRTIENWVKAIAEKSERFHNFICIFLGITIEFLQSLPVFRSRSLYVSKSGGWERRIDVYQSRSYRYYMNRVLRLPGCI